MRKVDLNCEFLTAAQRWELYQRAEQLGFLEGIPPKPGPLSEPLIHMDENAWAKIMMTREHARAPEAFGLDEQGRQAACYAWHVWRERVDIWESKHFVWSGGKGGKYSINWRAEAEKGGTGFMLYNTFISVFELERYFVNPWLRACAWLDTKQVEFLTKTHVTDRGTFKTKNIKIAGRTGLAAMK